MLMFISEHCGLDFALLCDSNTICVSRQSARPSLNCCAVPAGPAGPPISPGKSKHCARLNLDSISFCNDSDFVLLLLVSNCVTEEQKSCPGIV